jgi:uroporphyrinogen-III synthase
MIEKKAMTSEPQTASAEPAAKGLTGLRVLSLESRRAKEMAKLIENYGGTAVSAPSMREVPLADNTAALDFAAALFSGSVDSVIFLTGVGARILLEAIQTRHAREPMVEHLSHIAVIVRGPKPAAVLREYGVPVSVTVPEPNTWRDLIAAIEREIPALLSAGQRVYVQEYGKSNEELLRRLAAHGAEVRTVPVYQWALPEDTKPLQDAVSDLLAGRIDVVLATSAMQIHHLIQVAAEAGLTEQTRAALARAVIASIGPICTEALASYGLAADLEPSHPKMGQLVFEAANAARNLLSAKRNP